MQRGLVGSEMCIRDSFIADQKKALKLYGNCVIGGGNCKIQPDYISNYCEHSFCFECIDEALRSTSNKGDMAELGCPKCENYIDFKLYFEINPKQAKKISCGCKISEENCLGYADLVNMCGCTFCSACTEEIVKECFEQNSFDELFCVCENEFSHLLIRQISPEFAYKYEVATRAKGMKQ
eukprot:TRINITY_DN64808_c0_g1_i1.p2 TRINITY_DN64808_c0_g1~~TRINITY_DN64808_c0_g1_i1.p2  ORF type:complete len:180 (-),score=21.69 TRINITY_DN64808_c0_g1_i1:219-758(-)